MKKLAEPSFDDVFSMPEEEKSLATARGPAAVPFENSELAFANTSLADYAASEFGASVYDTDDELASRHADDQGVADPVFLGTVKQRAKKSSKPRSNTIWWMAALVALVVGIGWSWFMAGSQKPARPQEMSPLRATAPPPLMAAPASTPAPVPAAVAAEPPPAPTRPAVDESAQVRDLVEQWRQAWVARDVAAYLSFYSPQFVPARGQSHAQWQVARRKALSRPTEIALKLTDLRLQRVDEGQFKVEFLQDYASGTYREVAQPKTLMLVRSDTRWLIAREWQGAPDSTPLK